MVTLLDIASKLSDAFQRGTIAPGVIIGLPLLARAPEQGEHHAQGDCAECPCVAGRRMYQCRQYRDKARTVVAGDSRGSPDASSRQRHEDSRTPGVGLSLSLSAGLNLGPGLAGTSASVACSVSAIARGLPLRRRGRPGTVLARRPRRVHRAICAAGQYVRGRRHRDSGLCR
jgi:hypothetical protein